MPSSPGVKRHFPQGHYLRDRVGIRVGIRHHDPARIAPIPDLVVIRVVVTLSPSLPVILVLLSLVVIEHSGLTTTIPSVGVQHGAGLAQTQCSARLLLQHCYKLSRRTEVWGT